MPDWIWLAVLFLFGDGDDEPAGPGRPDYPDIPGPTTNGPTRPDIDVPTPTPGLPEFPDIPSPLDPSDVVRPFMKPTPDDGFFYQIRNNDSLFRIVQSAIGTNPGNPGNVPYARIVTASRFNWNLYGTPIDPEGNATERAAGVDGRWLKRAFLPRHADNKARLLDGLAPRRNIRATIRGQPCGSGSRYGLLWLPGVRVEGGELVVETPEPPAEITWALPAVMGTMETCE